MFSLYRNKNRKDRILEFQSRLLRELTLTSGSLQDRESTLANIAGAAREVLDFFFIFTFCPGNADKYELCFFWCTTPTAASVTAAERTVKMGIDAEPALQAARIFSIRNTNLVPSALFPDADKTGMEVRSKVFPLDTPNSSGMVGIGFSKIRKSRAEDETAIENTLVALANCTGSAKALASYTREIERFATRDPLTSLYNQIAFWDLLDYETERSKRQKYPFSLMVIDLDNFKTINDSYGHETGDRILAEFAALVKTAIRAGDIAARYAGDRFAAILPVCDEGQAYIVAKRIVENVRELSLTLENGNVIRQTASIGIAVFPDHAKEARDLYLLADKMLLQAKMFGKDRFSMPSEHDSVEVLRSMGDKNILVLQALSQRKIIPYFQPIMNMQDMKIEAHEVLTRIVMDGRVIPAAEFIETAESMGVIGKLDYQLIELAFDKVRRNGYQGNLFLNLSPKALILNEFMPTVRKLLRDYNIDPSKMVFEITERDTVKCLNVIEKYVHALRGEGFRFAIDDFGSGYSSFQYLRNFSVDFIKVDGDFIKNMNGTRMTEKAIVSSIAALSRTLGIKTIAEFVETEDILNQVESTGINYAQGYYIRSPSPDLA